MMNANKYHVTIQHFAEMFQVPIPVYVQKVKLVILYQNLDVICLANVKTTMTVRKISYAIKENVKILVE